VFPRGAAWRRFPVDLLAGRAGRGASHRLASRLETVAGGLALVGMGHSAAHHSFIQRFETSHLHPAVVSRLGTRRGARHPHRFEIAFMAWRMAADVVRTRGFGDWTLLAQILGRDE